jgi:hypothetical protein
VTDLRALVRQAVLDIDRGSTDTAQAWAEKVHAALAERGLAKNCHLDHPNHAAMTEDETIEWYAGQLLDIVDAKGWFAMNSFINCLDKFCPAPALTIPEAP